MKSLMTGEFRRLFTINLKKKNEITYWSGFWLITPAQLRKAAKIARNNTVAAIYNALEQLGFLKKYLLTLNNPVQI
jgi:hypothetical protein